MLQEGFSNTFWLWPSLIYYHYWFEDIDSVIVGIIIFILLTISCNQYFVNYVNHFWIRSYRLVVPKKLMTLLVK